MLFADAFKTATRSLTHGKMRSTLTMLGIVIGIASVIALMSIGQSAQDYILAQVKSVGSNLVFIIPGAPTSKVGATASEQGVVITTLNKRDADNLKHEPSITAAEPMVLGQANAVFGNNNKLVSFEGVDSGFFSVVQSLGVGKGQHFSQSDVDSGNHVAVIGPDLAVTLFGKYVNPIDKTFRLKDISFRVVGILEKGGTGMMGMDQGNLVLVPLSLAQHQLLGITYYKYIIVQADGAYDIGFVKTRITAILRSDHGITDPVKDDFDIRTQEDVVAILSSITSVLTMFLAAIAAISLVVGGIGIMNIMLVTVTERTKEIGLRKAVGATDRDILEQFLIESVVLTVVGGIVGVAFGALIVGGIYLAVTSLSTVTWTFAFPLSAVFLALGVSALAGIAFGLYPARQAARKNPIDALRYE